MRIAVLDDYQGVAMALADWSAVEKFATIDVFHEHLGDQSAVVEALQPYEVIVAIRERTRFPAEVLRALPQLELLVSTGPRNAAIDLAQATEQGITVTWTEGLMRPTTELAWGLIIALARDIVTEHNNIRAGRWQATVGRDLDGSTLGLLGLGTLGQQMAQIGAAFGMRVIAWSPHLTAERAQAGGAQLVSMAELFQKSDFLSIHMVLSEQTRGLVDRESLDLMKPTAYLVNTSRGPLVDAEALVAVLSERIIAGAGLDVFDTEPLPTSDPLVALDNVVLTPHLGYVTEGVYDKFFSQIVENIVAWRDGAPTRVSTAE